MRAQVCRISVCSLDLWAHSLQQNKSLRLFFMFNVYSRVSFGQRKGAQSLAALYEGRRSGLTRQRQQPSGSRVALCWEWSPGSSFGYAALPLATLRPATVTQAGLLPSEKGKPTFRAGLATTNSPQHPPS